MDAKGRGWWATLRAELVQWREQLKQEERDCRHDGKQPMCLRCATRYHM